MRKARAVVKALATAVLMAPAVVTPQQSPVVPPQPLLSRRNRLLRVAAGHSLQAIMAGACTHTTTTTTTTTTITHIAAATTTSEGAVVAAVEADILHLKGITTLVVMVVAVVTVVAEGVGAEEEDSVAGMLPQTGAQVDIIISIPSNK